MTQWVFFVLINEHNIWKWKIDADFPSKTGKTVDLSETTLYSHSSKMKQHNIAAVCFGMGIVILCRRQKERQQRKIWVKPCSPPNMY